MSKVKTDTKVPMQKHFRNAYLVWAADERALLKIQYPEWNGKTILSELSSRWKASDQKTKNHYKELWEITKPRHGKQGNQAKDENIGADNQHKSKRKQANPTKRQNIKQ